MSIAVTGAFNINSFGDQNCFKSGVLESYQSAPPLLQLLQPHVMVNSVLNTFQGVFSSYIVPMKKIQNVVHYTLISS
jgi:hypothetical protein